MSQPTAIWNARRSRIAREQILVTCLRPVVESLENRTLLSINAPSSFLPSPATSPGSSGTMLLTWADNSNNETGFKVERKTGAGGAWSEIGTAGSDATAFSDATTTGATQYFYRVRAYNASEDSAYSNELDATEWGSSNVGTVAGGSWSTANGVTSITTAGGGIGGTADDFRYAYRSLSGDGYIIARVASIQNTNPLAPAGVMLRNSLNANSRTVALSITPMGPLVS